MNKLLQRFYYGWWLIAIAIICVFVIVLSWLFIGINIIWLDVLIKILITGLFGIGCLVSLLVLFNSPDSM